MKLDINDLACLDVVGQRAGLREVGDVGGLPGINSGGEAGLELLVADVVDRNAGGRFEGCPAAFHLLIIRVGLGAIHGHGCAFVFTSQSFLQETTRGTASDRAEIIGSCRAGRCGRGGCGSFSGRSGSFGGCRRRVVPEWQRGLQSAAGVAVAGAPHAVKNIALITNKARVCQIAFFILSLLENTLNL